MKKHSNIPIFIQHMGCPNQCVFCDQHTITGAHSFCEESVRQDIDTALETIGNRECEIAYFGGSFTGIDRSQMLRLLDLAREYTDRGVVQGIRLSTRPDYISPEIVEILLQYPICAVELGIQSMDDMVLAASRRGHAAGDTTTACMLLRKAGIPFVGQMMTGLPAANIATETETAQQICEMGACGTRIYPCIVFQKTPLAHMVEDGTYTPLSVEEAVERSAAALEVFDAYGVPCLKIGLHDGEGLHRSDTYFAGPHHPALGEMVRSKVYLHKIEAALQDFDLLVKKTIRIGVAKGHVSMAVGQNKENKRRILEKSGAKSVKILENPCLRGYNITIDVL
ncbi:MAG: radical SAM protein [Clostridiales bacterium]|jgi:histone acetyltransferase (RNA polymerase elongator complex component)|nr:radical SAM protein [Clostridiales bacterium]